ncbi:MAG TPA: hypothetical protein VLP43_00750 [Solirubrobacteraceae bacterium]|nr:hypothetical protein [Solirubrobacteraceae bacterium]
MSKIAVAYDGSPESEQAQVLAQRIADERGDTLSTLTVVNRPGRVEPHPEASVDLLVLGLHSPSPPKRLVPRRKSQRLADEPASPLRARIGRGRRDHPERVMTIHPGGAEAVDVSTRKHQICARCGPHREGRART